MVIAVITARLAFRLWKRGLIGLIFAAGCLFARLPVTDDTTDHSASIKRWSEDELISLGLDHSRKLQFLQTNSEIADYRYRSSGWIDNPELRVSNRQDRYDDADEYDEWRYGVRWNVPKLGELGEDRQEARVALWERHVEENRYRHALVANIRRDYANVIRHDRLAGLAATRVQIENERIRIIEEMVKIGNRSIVYFTKAKMWHAESENDYTRAVESQTQARRRLAKRTGLDPEIRLIETDLPEVTLELDELLDIAYKNRPEIRLVEERTELAVRQKRYELMKLIPWIDFIEVTQHRDNKKRDDWKEFKVAVELPVFNWNLGNIKATNLAVKKKESQSDAMRETIEEEVRTAYTQYQDLLLEWHNFKKDAAILISEAQTVCREAKQHHTLMSDEIYEMELTIIETEELLAEKRQNLAYALVDLYYEIGIQNHDQLSQQ
ncbi:TolC family protein [bacterium]|nr:TolC family protein [bacterium]